MVLGWDAVSYGRGAPVREEGGVEGTAVADFAAARPEGLGQLQLVGLLLGGHYHAPHVVGVRRVRLRIRIDNLFRVRVD